MHLPGERCIVIEGPCFRTLVPGSRREQLSGWLKSGRRKGGKGGADGGGTLQGAPAAPPGLSSIQIKPQGDVDMGDDSPLRPSLSWAHCGRWMKLHMPGVFHGVRSPRTKIKKFTDRSRRELLRVVNSIDRSRFDPSRVVMVTLTYPAEFPSARASKRDLAVFLKRFRRAYGEVAVVWKLEPQKRGAPHFHLLLFMQSSYCLPTLISWVSHNWYEVVDSGDVKHLYAGTRCEQIRDWGGVASYAAKYLGKSCTSEDWSFPGRFWGVQCRAQLPVKIEKRDVSNRVAALLRRACIRWYDRQHSGRYYVPGKALSSGRHLPGRVFFAGQKFTLPGVLHPTTFGKCWERVGQMMEVAVRPIRRRWGRSSGGCSMFIPAEMVERLLPWALSQVGQSSG